MLAGSVTVVALALGSSCCRRACSALNLLIGALVFGIAFYAFREVFKRKSGGLGFR